MVGFCGEPFADNGDLLSSLSPLLTSMKLFGLYYQRKNRRKRSIDDPEPERNSDTTKTVLSKPATTWNKLQIHASVVLTLSWLNVFRLVFLITKSDRFGADLLMKIAVFSWFGLSAVLQTAYYYASHSGKLVKVLLTLPVTEDCVLKAHRAAVGLTVFTWTTLIINGIIGVYFYLDTDGRFDYNTAPLFTYIEVPEDKLVISRLVGSLLHLLQIPATVLCPVMTQVLVYVFYHQFRKLKKNFGRAIGKKGQLSTDLSVFRRRHQTLCSAVSKLDGFMMFSNVGGFACHIANTIVLLYSVIFYRDTTETPISTFIYVSVLQANVLGLFFAASAGIVVNYMVSLCNLYYQ